MPCTDEATPWSVRRHCCWPLHWAELVPARSDLWLAEACARACPGSRCPRAAGSGTRSLGACRALWGREGRAWAHQTAQRQGGGQGEWGEAQPRSCSRET